MRTLVQTLKRNTYGLAALVLLSAMVVPAVLSSAVSAEQVTERSIDMSTSSPGVAATSYLVQFTPASTATIQGIVIDFCQESAVIGAACTSPDSMVVGTGIAPGAFEIDGTPDNNWTATSVAGSSGVGISIAPSQVAMADDTPISIAITGFTNPAAPAGTFYARILTFTDDDFADDYESEEVDAGGAPTDTGGVAMSTVDDIDVTAVVSESLTFCVSGTAPDDGCTNTTPASLTLGEGTGDALALTNTDISEAIAYFQLSTNADGVTAVKVRNGAASGGLNSGTNSIPPIDQATPTALADGIAGFGLRVPASTAGDPGSVAVVGTSPYASGTADQLNLRAPEGTSPYGDEIANTNTGGPVSNANVPVTFGAQASNLTAAGIYTAAIVLIATSTY